jgi:hypothetical protein
MRALATWSPAPYLNVSAVEREESRWLVTVYSREGACCPICGVQSSSRHSVYSRTLGDLSAQGTPVTVRVRVGRAAGTIGAIAGSSPNAFRDLQPRSRVRPPAWRGSSGCLVTARAGAPPSG